MKYFVPLLGLFIILFGCVRERPPTAEAVIGKYLGEYDNAVESLELKPDWTFVQELLVNGTRAYKNEGTWRIVGNEIAFDHFFRAMRPGSGELTVPKVRTDNLRGLWIFLNGRSEIVFDVDHNYRIKKL